ncbi:MAG TPA: RNA-binding domain-containing protein [Alphaproteobacteria bacterium]|nr:RNA-binding domain-containing protein [Alphaproteobacteria bacterium]
MKLLHNAKITLFVKPEDKTSLADYEKIFKKLAPLDFEKEKLSVKTEIVEGLEGRKIKILSLELSKESHTNTFIKTLKDLIGLEACKTIEGQKESRLDEELFFYIRLDRKKALENEFELTDSGECIHIKLSLAAFPKNKESALKLVEKIFLGK